MTLGERDGAPFFHCHALWTRGRWRCCTAVTSCPRRPSSPSRSRWRRSASTARCSWPSRIPRPISSCSDRWPARSRTPRRRAAPLRCGCGRTRISPARWRASAGERGILRARIHGGVGSTIGARFADGRSVEPFATELAISAGAIAPGAGGDAARGARRRAGRLSRRHRRGPARARRQSGADDDGAGARGACESAAGLRARSKAQLRRTQRLAIANGIVRRGGRAKRSLGRAVAWPAGFCPLERLLPSQQRVTRFRG